MYVKFPANRYRISVTCFMMALVKGQDTASPIANPNMHTLPSSKALWEAKTSWEWEHEYDLASRRVHPSPRLETVGDFIIAKLGCPGKSGVDSQKEVIEEMIDKWYSEMDGLGMMLAALVASL